MHELHSIKDKLLKELKEYNGKQSFSPSDAETIKNLISGVNKLCGYIDAQEEKEYSNRGSYGRGSYGEGSYEGSYNSYGASYDDGSYARGRRGNVKRDSMGRYSRESGYSRNDEMTNKLYEVMDEAPENMKHEIQRLLDKMEQH